ncbi:MAG TPA: chorismate-binding protein [Pricia sp.]|nr:chorismate-binding protein [Pricia sp.]
MDFFEKIADHYRKNLPFVAYRKPGETLVKAIMQSHDRLQHLKNFSGTGFVFAPFSADRPTILLTPDEILELNDPGPTQNPDPAKQVSGNTSSTNAKASHLALVEKGIAKIAKGDLQKVVLSRRLEIDSTAYPLDLFQKLLARYPNAFCYFWYHPKVGLWVGATPEILLRLRNRHLTTMSLAGTQAYTGTESPIWGYKELEEQELVTDYIFDVLKDQVSSLQRGSTESVRAGNLLHLRTRISGHIKGKSLESVVKVLHPTPAVCGMPQKKARKFIVKNEKYDREFYTGFLGELNFKSEKRRSTDTKNQENQVYRSIAETTTLYVNLRCMQLKDDKAYIYVGGGITKDSDAEKEWEETVAKSNTMLRILG